MRRRHIITLLGASAAPWPLAVRTQQPERIRRIGVLMSLAADDSGSARRLTAFVQGLQQLGWTDGRNVQIAYRWGGDPERIRNTRPNWFQKTRWSGRNGHRSQGGFSMKIRRGIAGLLACVVTSAMILVATLLPASADDPKEHPEDRLINVGSGKCFRPTPQDGQLDWAGLPIQQRTCDFSHTGDIERYGFEVVDFVNFSSWCFLCIATTKVYFIKNVRTQQCMDARDGAKSDWSVVQQWTCRDRNARSMVWYSERSDFPGALKLRNLNSDLCLDVRWGSSDEGAQLQQYHCTSNNAAQNFWQNDGTADRTVMDLNGYWTDGSTRLTDGSTLSARIYQGPGSIAIDMSDFGRPNAGGRSSFPDIIEVTFPDDGTYTGQPLPPKTIRWSNGSIWTKLP